MIYVLFVAAQIHFIQHQYNNFCLELQVEVITATTAFYPGKPGRAGTRQTFTLSLSILAGIIQYLWLSWASNDRNEISVQCTCMQITVADVCACVCVHVCVRVDYNVSNENWNCSFSMFPNHYTIIQFSLGSWLPLVWKTWKSHGIRDRPGKHEKTVPGICAWKMHKLTISMWTRAVFCCSL